MMTSSDRSPNRLIEETSPYLLQHALNPVDWHPWGDEAFALAAEQDKPVFLSVGYSACHWCHVMERESFESDEIAALMNEHFISIKVDREERPDVDQIYMSAVQLMTQRGGWPMSVFLTPDKRPFYGGTYWPPTSRRGMPGFREILLKIHEVWSQRRDEVMRSAGSLVDAINRMAAPELGRSNLDEEVLRNGMREILRSADRRHGGFGGAPKFPHPMDLRVLLRCWIRFDNQDALDVVTLTLDKMARGGIYDHLGGGFHRYSTDARWLVPHFEKMLYDNALLVPACLELGQILGNDHPDGSWPFAVVRETLDSVLREMEQPPGGFYSTQDADSEGVEGKFFVWSESEIDERLGDADAGLFKYAYDVTPQGNWEGKTILNRPKPLGEAARMLGIEPEELAVVLARCRRTLFDAREQRVKPGRDDKVLVAWNGWMISAMARAAQVLGETRYAEAACRAADFVLDTLWNDESFLFHSFKDGRARFNAYLDDYAALIGGLIDLHQATFDVRHLESARALAVQMIDRFEDKRAGGFFYTPHDHEALIARTKDCQDNATPSGNAQAATALIQLGQVTGQVEFIERGQATLESFGGLLSEHPRASGQGLLALDALLGPTREVVLVDGEDPSVTDEWLAAIRRVFLPNLIVLRRDSSMTEETLPEVIRPHLEGRTARDGRTIAYVCCERTCGPPLTSIEELIGVLRAG